ncbi:hypothetical protein KUTeg_021696 [Tegillarca granosa]|uniref:Huntingtin n=1 Tax=Tegillarca granosa TaxID=220873 RepID=A0ABQ9E9G4_TEGGR|nr:hypothetical protein KUTeg_021696 [Tegillarca granosa]
MVDIPPDADDETMVELAIALSLQDQPGHGGSVPGALGLQGLGQQSISSLEEGPLSDTTASAPGSDDEIGSTAATDGSTLRTSPAEPAGSAGSDSGGSAMGSVSGDHSGGVRAIPFMQVLLMLTSDLDSEEEKDKAALDNLLMTLVKALDLSNAQASSSFISNQTASALITSEAIPYCLTVLKNLLPYWKQFSSQEVRSS